MNLIEIGSRIKAHRKGMGISQEKLSEMIYVSPHYIYEIERGSKAMSLETLMNMSEALRLSVDYILFGNRPECRKKEFEAKLINVFDGCTDDEIYLMLAVAESAKKALRERNI